VHGGQNPRDFLMTLPFRHFVLIALTKIRIPDDGHLQRLWRCGDWRARQT
jgi:hypothetical protein